MSKLTSQSVLIVNIMVCKLEMLKDGKLVAMQYTVYHILFYPIKFFFIIYYIIHLADDLSNATLIAFKVYI